MKRTLLSILAALSLLVAAACTEPGSRRDALMSSDMSSLLTAMDALQIAQGEVPGGVVVEAELEIEGDDDDEEEPPTWEVELFVPDTGELVEVELHAVTGEILEVETDEDDDDDDDDDDD